MLMKGTWVVELSEMDVMLRTEESPRQKLCDHVQR